MALNPSAISLPLYETPIAYGNSLSFEAFSKQIPNTR
jgi:hypothetical protein